MARPAAEETGAGTARATHDPALKAVTTPRTN
jgi:hypothetical protein